MRLNLYPRLPFFPGSSPALQTSSPFSGSLNSGQWTRSLFLLRTWIVGFFFGFSFLTMALALSGGVLSTVTMAWHGN